MFPQGTIANIGSDNGLALKKRQAIIWTNDGLVYGHIYASLRLDEFIYNARQLASLSSPLHFFQPSAVSRMLVAKL